MKFLTKNYYNYYICYMKTLKEIYNSNEDVRKSDIPQFWLENFLNFMMGSTITADFDDDGNIIEYVYYSHDFRMWYRLNELEIERDSKINNILD
jgi:hypothetical protein